MSLKVSFFSKVRYLTVFVLLIAISCSSGSYSSQSQEEGSTFTNSFNVPGQIVASEHVASITLDPTGKPGAAPIIELSSDDQLTLQFDLIEFENRQLTLRFTHHNPDWSRSSLPPDFFRDGFSTLFMDFGAVSQNTRPLYRTYTYEFPNDEITFLRSGNYMLYVEDSDNGNLLFSIPFFIFENKGSIRSSMQTRLVPRQNNRVMHQLRNMYTLPEEVSQPQFDLEFYFIQNQFWGRSVKADELDFSDENEVFFETATDQYFIGDYEFRSLYLEDLTNQNPQIFESDPTQIPPLVRIFDDAEGFSNGTPLRGKFGRPSNDANAQYANVQFHFDPAESPPENSEIYLVGDFNNWSIRSQHQLSYNTDTKRWQTSAMIKQGIYNYKYILFNNNTINDTFFDDLFTNTRQEYHAFVYMRDSQQFYYRLLQINQFIGG